MDRFVATHASAAGDGVVAGPMTMGYYTRQDLDFYYALADAFTICDRYHCSIMGPTDPNRVYSMSGTIDPDGTLGGGPFVDNPGNTFPFVPGTGTPSLHWTTMPEALEKAGISWKFYQPAATQLVGMFSNNPLVYFPPFRNPGSTLFQKGIAPTFPGDFQNDVAAGRLPQVSWIASTAGLDEHPPAPIPFGELLVTRLVLSTLLANPAVWERTVLFVTYDENGGFFDHVPPPTAPPGTSGEWIPNGVKPAIGNAGNPPIRGPIGLGFRVPMLVLSPYTVGGLVSSDVSDHTSTLRFIERRFGVPVPNLSAWRRANTGDLTGTINFAAGAQATPAVVTGAQTAARAAADLAKAVQQCPANAVLDAAGRPVPYPIPRVQTVPSQLPRIPKRPSGPVACKP
jgi:phospholipase C